MQKELGEWNFGFDSLKSRLNRDMEEKGIVADVFSRQLSVPLFPPLGRMRTPPAGLLRRQSQPVQPESSGRVRRKSPPEESTGRVHRRGPHMTERREQWCIGEMTCRWAAGGLPVTCQGLIEHAGHVTNPLACMHNGTVLTRAISRIAGPGLLSPAINTRGQQPSASIEVSRSTL